MHDDNLTLQYYDQNAAAYASATQNIDLTSIYKEFLSRLKKDSLILDFGCGSGRDTKIFLKNNMRVESIDGSLELCKLASDYAGIPVKHMLFQELNESNKYDAIWACSSLLHLKKKELVNVLNAMVKAVKKDGIIYMSYKDGNYEGVMDNRYYTYLDEKSIKELISNTGNIKIEKIWKTKNENLNVNWINVIVKKWHNKNEIKKSWFSSFFLI